MPHKYPFTAEGYHNARQHYLRTGNFVPYSLGYFKDKMPPAPAKRAREQPRSAPYAKKRVAHGAQLTDAEMNWAYDQGMKKASTMALQRSAKFGNELRGFDTPISLTPIIDTTTTNASSYFLNGTSQGSASWNRIGNKIAMQSLRIRGIIGSLLLPDGTTGNMQDNYVRMVVVYDKTPSGVLPNWNDIFGDTNNLGTTSSSIFDSLNLLRTKRFRVLKDCNYAINAGASPAAGTGKGQNVSQYFDEFVPLKGLETQYTASQSPPTAPLIADVSSGGLYVYFRASDNTAITAGFVAGVARLRFQP